MRLFVRNVLRLVLMMLIQVLILNEITVHIPGLPPFIPYLYPLFILLLPFETPVWTQMVVGMVLGLIIDSFLNTGGIHAFATVLIAYLRTNLFNALLPRALEEFPNQSPGLESMGWSRFLAYSAILVFIHHAVFFTLEVWSFSDPVYLLLKIIVSGLTTMLFILCYLLLFSPRQALRD